MAEDWTKEFFVFRKFLEENKFFVRICVISFEMWLIPAINGTWYIQCNKNYYMLANAYTKMRLPLYHSYDINQMWINGNGQSNKHVHCRYNVVKKIVDKTNYFFTSDALYLWTEDCRDVKTYLHVYMYIKALWNVLFMIFYKIYTMFI